MIELNAAGLAMMALAAWPILTIRPLQQVVRLRPRPIIATTRIRRRLLMAAGQRKGDQRERGQREGAQRGTRFPHYQTPF